MKKVFLMFLVLSCAGCANKIWTNSSKSQQEYLRDNAKCEAMSNSTGRGQMLYSGGVFANGHSQGTGIDAIGARTQIYNNCMTDEGWSLVEEN